jgi:hypothetical protein
MEAAARSRPASAASAAPPAARASAGLPRTASALGRLQSPSLRRALSSIVQRGDGASEARTVLPGVDLLGLSLHLPYASDSDDDADAAAAGSPEQGLPVLQTPRGVSLKDALLQAGGVPWSLAGSASGSPATPTFLLAAAEAFASGGRSLPPLRPASGAAEGPSAWQAFTAGLARSPPSSPLGRAGAAQQHTPGGSPPLAMTPPPGGPPPARPPRRPPPLRLDSADDVGGTPPGAAPLSPHLPFTPGPAAGLPLEARAEAAAAMWPTLGPFTPRMLRDDILLPPARRRFVAFDPGDDAPGDSPAAAPPPALTAGTGPRARAFPAALAVADISGFTALTEALSREGPGGVELLTRCMNGLFSRVIDLALEHGGDVSKFAGDAMMILFEPTPGEAAGAAAAAAAAAQGGGGGDGGLAAATARAARCVRELVERFGVMRMQPGGEVKPVPRHLVRQVGNRLEWAAAQGAAPEPQAAAGPLATRQVRCPLPPLPPLPPRPQAGNPVFILRTRC